MTNAATPSLALRKLLRMRRNSIILVCVVLLGLMLGTVFVWYSLLDRAVNRRLRELTASGAIRGDLNCPIFKPFLEKQ